MKPPDPQDVPRKVTSRSSSTNALWRVAGALGVVITLAMALLESFPLQPRQSRGFLFAAVIAGVTIVVLGTLFRPAWKKLSTTPDLLVPVGVALLGLAAIRLAAKLRLLSVLLMSGWSMTFLSVPLSVSLDAVLEVIVWTAFAAWQTDLVWRSVQTGGTFDLSPWAPIRRHFFRAFIVLTIGVGVLLAGVVAAVAFAAAALVVGIVFIAIIAVFWNLLTAVLLPVALFQPNPILPAIRRGFECSWTLKGRWWKQLVTQMLLLGFVVILRVHFTSAEPTAGSHWQTRTNSQWQVNAFWTGGYEFSCRWYSKYAAALETDPLPILSEALNILFLVVAVAVKITVIRELHDCLPASAAPVSHASS